MAPKWLDHWTTWAGQRRRSILTLAEVLLLLVGLERVVLDGDDEVPAVVVEARRVQCAHEVDQRVRIAEKHVD